MMRVEEHECDVDVVVYVYAPCCPSVVDVAPSKNQTVSSQWMLNLSRWEIAVLVIAPLFKVQMPTRLRCEV